MSDDEIIEINSDTNDQEIKLAIDTNKKESLKEKWHNLDQKTKALIIGIPLVLLVIIIFLLLFLFIFKNNSDHNDAKPNDNEVVISKDNYRYENGNLIFLDKRDQVIGTYECTNKNPDTCMIAKSDFTNDTFDRVISVNELGEELFLTSSIYFDNYVFVQDGTEIYLYNIKNKNKELTLKNIKIYDIASNLVVIEDENNRYGLINLASDSYNYLINCTYDNLGIINSKLNYLVAEDKNTVYLLDKDGKKISSNITVEIKSVNEDYFVGVDNNSYSLYTLKNKKVLEDYDYISLHSKIIALVNNRKLYLRDNDLNKLNEEGISLSNDNYVKKYIYDKDNKLKETLEAYEITNNNNLIEVNIDDEKIEINSLEGLISKEYDYMSFYNNILYFYSDTSKNTLIGSYECLSKNEITNETNNFNKCSIYNNELGLSGIYNNQFAFIKDGDNIYLYDLKNNKNMGTYSELTILNSSEINKNIKQIYTPSSYILAKSAIGSNKDNYGILEITLEKAQGKIEFKYKEITKKNDYYLMVNTANIYSVYNHDLKKISNEFSYIELYDNYYVGISDNKLNIYKYDDPLGILEEGLNIEDNKFTITFEDYFTITIGENVYKYNFEGSVYE